jgi:hypothetical protein
MGQNGFVVNVMTHHKGFAKHPSHGQLNQGSVQGPSHMFGIAL